MYGSQKSLAGLSGGAKLQHRFHAGTDVQLMIDVTKVPAHGAIGEADAFCDLLVGKSLAQ